MNVPSPVPDLDKERPVPIPQLLDWRKMEVCLINFNKGDDDILQYSEIEGNCVWKITDGLFRNYSTLRQHKCESPKKYYTHWSEAPYILRP